MNNIRDIYGSCILVVLVGAIGLWIIFRKEARGVASLVAPYLIAGVMVALLLSVAEMLYGLSLRKNLIELTWNLTLCFRNSVFAVVGLTLFGMEGSLRPLKRWDDGSRYFADIPVNYSFIAVGGCAIFGIMWFYMVMGGSSIENVVRSHFVGSLSIAIEAALVEELFRLFLIGTIVYFMRSHGYRWTVAIIISTAIWTISHFGNDNFGIMMALQLIPLGLILGYTLKRYGYETALLIHMSVNIVVVLVQYFRS